MAGSSQGTKEEEEYDRRQSITSYFLESYRSRSQSHGLRQQEHTREQTFCSPLVSLGESILSALECLIRMATGVCMNSRHSDSWSFRNTSISVSKSIARFSRDLFAYLDPDDVHRLILVYFSRFVSKEGKQWKDTYSKIGLHCSWEVSKLRLTSVTTFVRMLDFEKINKPLMDTWGDWSLKPPTRSNRHIRHNSERSIYCAQTSIALL
eukprot:scaffold2090_cov151-Chaetoceros_neogracile.AAC.6